MISAVVLAAGASSRMGRQKLLLPLGGEPLVRRTVRQVCEAGFDDVLVIVGRDHEAVLAALEGLRIRHALNPDYASGMGSSFRVAVEALPEADAALFALADQPLVASAHFARVRDVYAGNPGGIVSVRYGDVTAPPQIFARRYFPELSLLKEGARPVIERHAAEVTVVPFEPGLLLDVDTPEDYARAKALVEKPRTS